MRYLVTLVFLFFICNLYSTDAYNDKNSISISTNEFKMIVEIPAGTNKKYEYDNNKSEFKAEIINGKERYVKYLPYIGNYGFIPFTKLNKKDGGDGDAIDVLLLSEALPTGTIINITPIAILKLNDNGEEDSKIIAVPADDGKKIINLSSYADLDINFPSIKKIIEIWFLSYKGGQIVIFQGWGNEKEAIIEINKHLIKD